MTFAAQPPSGSGSGQVTASLGMSLLLHLGLVAAFLALRPSPALPSPPIYRVNIIAAPPGPAAAGVITPNPAAPELETPTPPRPKTDEIVPVQTKTPPRRLPR